MEKQFYGLLEQAVQFIERNQICEVGLWQKFVEQYRTKPDGEDGYWRCEYWGKMMRGACMILAYTHDAEMYRIVEFAIRDMLTTQDALGRFSTHTSDHEFFGWDMWGRKYVLLGFQYFLPLCKDAALHEQIMHAITQHADYIIEKIGNNEGQIPICQTSETWGGMNSCSILEPMVRMYELTKEKRYLDFSKYIISTGFYKDDNLIELAYQNQKAPYEYPVTKAYEMMSCFEGLLRYYYLTGEERYKTAILNFGQKIIETEISIIGCCGCTHELFDHTALTQTKLGYDGVMQETCVAVTWMKFAAALLQLSDDPRYADCIEQTFYNCYLGSLNTHRCMTANQPTEFLQVMPFDSYSPLTADKRGKMVGGYCSFPDHTFYGCCACIGAAGAGVIPQMALSYTNGIFTFNYYEQSAFSIATPKDQRLSIHVDTQYPLDGQINIRLALNTPETFTIRLRIPGWCRHASLVINGTAHAITTGYTAISRTWKDGDTLTLSLDMPVVQILPPEQAENRERFAAYLRGPIVLAADCRVTEPTAVWKMECDTDGTVSAKAASCPEIPDCLLCYALQLQNGERVRLIDYASAGKTWDEKSLCAAWLYRA